MNNYFTVKNFGFEEYEVKHSKFIGYAKPVISNDEAVDFINEIRQKHRDATHNVYAYNLRNGQIRRYSDDGEPQGTAGMPVLDVLVKEEIQDVCVVVTRYFGGILLGTGGLVRAYSHSAKLAVDKARIIKMGLCCVAKTLCDYNFYSQMQNILNEFDCLIEKTDFSDKVYIEFSVDDCKSKDVFDKIIDVSNGKFFAEKVDVRFSQMKI